MNTIKNANLKLSNRDRYFIYFLHSSLNPIKLENVQSAVIPNQYSFILDNDIRRSRYFEFKAEENMDSSNCSKRILWEKNVRRIRSFMYSATIQGHTFLGIPHRINTLIDVQDDFCKVYDTLLIKSLVFNYDLDTGSTTDFVCVLKNAYTLELEKQSKSNKNEYLLDLTDEEVNTIKKDVAKTGKEQK